MALDANGCEIVKIDSNLSGLSIAEEKCLRELPTVPVWRAYEPNSYADFGGELSTVARAPIDPSRQNKKGAVVDMDASGGFNIDKTRRNLLRLLQGFFFADARERFSTRSLLAAAIPVTAVAAATDSMSIAGAVGFVPGAIVQCSGFGFSANNGVKVVASSTATEVVFDAATLEDETPPASATVATIGHQFEAGDVALVLNGNVLSMTATAADFLALGVIPGMWVFLGGDNAANRFTDNTGFVRVSSVTAKRMSFDDVAYIDGKAPTADTGAGKSVQVFLPTVIRNEKDPSLIKRRSYQLERTLGEGTEGTQAEYLEGAVANEFTLNIPQGDKLNADLTFVACESVYRSGATDDKLKTGTRVPADGDEAINTTSDIYRMKMSLLDPTTSQPSPLFGYVTEGNITINNNVTPIKVLAKMGAVDVSLGNFEVGGELTVLFTTTAAVNAVKRNADVGYNTIFARDNSGFVFDIPLLGLGGGRINVEKDNPITVPLEPAGAENTLGYTMMYCHFDYLPNLAMPQ